VISGHLGKFKTFPKIAVNFYLLKMRAEIFEYVHRRDFCQRAKKAQKVHVDLHSSSPVSEPMERLFMDFMGPLTRLKRENIMILVVLNAFCKFVSFFTFRKISFQVVWDQRGRFSLHMVRPCPW